MLPQPVARSAPPPAFGGGRHPNELDLRRIARALEKRVRYRYVSPEVEPIPRGYRIVSPCCSRNVDPQGGVIDIARLEYDEAAGRWALFRKDHQRDLWHLHACSCRLAELLAQLAEDPARAFWQ